MKRKEIETRVALIAEEGPGDAAARQAFSELVIEFLDNVQTIADHVRNSNETKPLTPRAD